MLLLHAESWGVLLQGRGLSGPLLNRRRLSSRCHRTKLAAWLHADRCQPKASTLCGAVAAVAETQKHSTCLPGNREGHGHVTHPTYTMLVVPLPPAAAAAAAPAAAGDLLLGPGASSPLSESDPCCCCLCLGMTAAAAADKLQQPDNKGRVGAARKAL